ncbi:hypothetical protein SEVIR_9G553401v4 [Setaria viridis]
MRRGRAGAARLPLPAGRAGSSVVAGCHLKAVARGCRPRSREPTARPLAPGDALALFPCAPCDIVTCELLRAYAAWHGGAGGWQAGKRGAHTNARPLAHPRKRRFCPMLHCTVPRHVVTADGDLALSCTVRPPDRAHRGSVYRAIDARVEMLVENTWARIMATPRIACSV